MKKIKLGKYEENTNPNSKTRGYLTGIVDGELEEYYVFSESLGAWLKNQPKNTEFGFEDYISRDKDTKEIKYKSITGIEGIETSEDKPKPAQVKEEEAKGGNLAQAQYWKDKLDLDCERFVLEQKKQVDSAKLMFISYAKDLAVAKLITPKNIVPTAETFLRWFNGDEDFLPSEQDLELGLSDGELKKKG